MSEYEQLLQHVPYALLVIFRIAGLLTFAPVLSSTVVPPRIKGALAILLGLLIYPTVSVTPAEAVTLDLWALLPLIGFEMLTGVAIGFVGMLPLQAVQIGARMMSQQMGLAFAQIFNPAMDTEADVVGQALFFMTLTSFMLIGGLEAMLLAVANSFHHLPTGTGAIDGDYLALLTGLLNAAFELALRVAAPVVGLIFMQGVAMGFITKTVPQLNIMSLGFPIRILVGLTTLAFGLAVINDVVVDGIDAALSALFAWIETG